MFFIERISLSTLNRDLVNTNNHPKDPDDIEANSQDYRTEISKTYLSKYAHLVGYKIDWVYDLTDTEVKILLEACKVGIIVLRRPKIFDDELAIVENRLAENWINCDDGYFMRMDAASPKEACNGFPFKSPKDIINALVTSKRTFNSLVDGLKRLYFVKFDTTWETGRELRCFIHKRKLTAISQYCWFNVGYLNGLNDDILQLIGQNVKLFLEKLANEICHEIQTDSFVGDVYVNPDYSIRLVELNSFGYWLASGSALFSWLPDKEKLYNTHGDVYFKILCN
jgi:hypothetical protein